MHATCCVPLCPNDFKTSHGLAFYRIPKARLIRREYARWLRNDNLNLNSRWDGGEKRSRTHLPSIFLWSKKKYVNDEFYTGQRQTFKIKSQEKKHWHLLSRNGRWGWLSKWSVTWVDWRGQSKQQCFTDSFLLWCWDANWNNRRISIGIWIKIDWRGKRQVHFSKRKRGVD